VKLGNDRGILLSPLSVVPNSHPWGGSFNSHLNFRSELLSQFRLSCARDVQLLNLVFLECRTALIFERKQ